MCTQIHVRYLCGCPQSTRTNACRTCLAAAKRGLPHDVTTTEECLNESCPWGCGVSTFVKGFSGRLERYPKETTVSTIPPPPPVLAFVASSVSSAGNEEVEQDRRSRTASADGSEAPSTERKSLMIKLFYPSDIECLVSDRTECYASDDDATATGADARPEEQQLSIVMQHNRPRNRSLRAASSSSRNSSYYSGVTKNPAQRAQKTKFGVVQLRD